MAIEDKKAAIGTLVDLRKMGMSEVEVVKLVKVANGWGNGNGFELDNELNICKIRIVNHTHKLGKDPQRS